MFAKTFKHTFPSATILGFVDKVKSGEDIVKLDKVIPKSFDYMLIVSANYFSSIYAEQKKVLPSRKILKVEVVKNSYIFLQRKEILAQKLKNFPQRILLSYLNFCVALLKIFSIKPTHIAFVSKSFVGNNLKALLVESSANKNNTILLTDNEYQRYEFSKISVQTKKLHSFSGFWALARAQKIVQDQGDFTHPLNLLLSKQEKIQMWHGVPLKKLNRLFGITYDWMISTSDYVNESSLKSVIDAKNYSNLGYPRNDLLLKDHSVRDLVLCDRELYGRAKNAFVTKKQKVIVYMPTHRESATSIGKARSYLMPLDFESLNTFCSENNFLMVVKLHPFVMQFQSDFSPPEGYSNVYFHSTQGDIYPLLKYTDLLITDYSSIYFDFLLLDRPVIFYDYDYEEYSSNMGGFFYNYQENAPGEHANKQDLLHKAILNSVNFPDNYSYARLQCRKKFFTYNDAKSSERILKQILN
ncbi:CDP-glycerol glycerophosphotransferase family protein [Opitutales bacterium]|nr:CDP-glycerol glycerophosphotransferase family protein [Opitutales bacterium]